MDMAKHRKRQLLTIKTKLAIFQAIDEGKRKIDVAETFGIPPSSLTSILKKRKETEAAAHQGFTRKRSRAVKNEDLDKRVFDWLMDARGRNIPISGPIMQQKAREMALKMGIDNLQGSNGWLEKFKVRWNLGTLKMCGEEATVSTIVEEEWKKTLHTIVMGYAAKDIFNADEAGFFFNLLPDRTLAVKGEPCHGGKKSKERFTVLFCTNADGTEKLEPLVIGKYKKPRCFKNIKKFPCLYRNSRKSWITAALFNEWLHMLDSKMGMKNRKIILFMDQCTAHKSEGIILRNIKIVYFPPNTTSKLQPLDQGVIASVKRNYRQQLVLYILRNVDEANDLTRCKWNILQAMHRLCISWNSVQSASINKCFIKAGFMRTTYEEDEVSDDEPLEWAEINKIFHLQTSFNDFVDVDTSLVTCAPTEGEMVEEVGIEIVRENIADNNEENDDGEIIPPPKKREVQEALSVLERFFINMEDYSDNNLLLLNRIENIVSNEFKKNMTQTEITSFLSNKQ